MIAIIILFTASFFFFLCQWSATSSLSITDVNNYIYIAKLLGEGKILYKDIFLDNFPLATYIALFYKTITFGDLHFFKVTATLEGIAITWLLYFYQYKKSKSQFIGLLVAFTFCSSFLFLRTAVNQSGVYNALLLFLISFVFWENKSFTKSGVFASLSVLTKAYMFPLSLALFVATIVEHRKETVKFMVAGLIAGVVVMLPTFLFAFPQFLEQTLSYGLVRAVTETKGYIFSFLIQFDFLAIALLFSAWFLYKKSLPVFLMSIFTPLFFVFYKDFYYIYFSMLVLISALASGVWLTWFQKKSYGKYVLIFYAVILSIILIRNATFIMARTVNVNEIPEIEKLYDVIRKEKPDSIYTYAVLGNGLSYVLGIPPFQGHIDITENQFESKILDKKKITADAAKSRTIIILYGSARKQGMILDPGIADYKVLKDNNCQNIHIHPLHSGQTNVTHLVVLKCYK